MSLKPLDKTTLEALDTIGDTAFEIRQRAFETISGKMSLQDFLVEAGEHVAFLTQALPLVRARLSDESVGEEQEEQLDPRTSIAKVCTAYILVPVVKTQATDRGFTVKQPGEPS